MSTPAHIAPLLVFMALNLIPDLVRVENPELPWFRRAPEQWVYPLQTLVVGYLLLAFRRGFQLRPWRGLGLATVAAVAGIAFWVTPAWIGEWLREHGHTLGSWSRWLGLVERREGFDPSVFADWPAWQNAALAMRFARMVIVVPLIEELFWRGFLMRYVISGDRPWQQVPFGKHDWRSYLVVTALVVAAHGTEDYLAAFVWGSLVYFVAVRTKSLGACVVMHAAGNLCLGIYVLRTEQWGFW